MRASCKTILAGLAFLLIWGCSPKGLIQTDPTGKCPPPQNVFAASKVDVKVAGDAVNKFITGQIDIKSEPQIYSLASQSMTDEQLADYLDCLAQYRDGWTKEQIVYRQKMRQFMKAQPTPTPDQVIKWQKENPFPVKENISAHVSYKIASVLPGSEQFDFLKDWRVWFQIENLEQRKSKAYIKITFISDGFRQEINDGYYGGETPWKLNAFSGIQAPGLIIPEKIKEKAKQKKKIEIQIGCVIKDENDKLIEKKLPIGYVHDYSIKEWYLEP